MANQPPPSFDNQPYFNSSLTNIYSHYSPVSYQDQPAIGDDAPPSQPLRLSFPPPMTATRYAEYAGGIAQSGAPTQNNTAMSGTRITHWQPAPVYEVNSSQRSGFPNGINTILPPQPAMPVWQPPHASLREYSTVPAYRTNALLQMHQGSNLAFNAETRVDTVAHWDGSPAAYPTPSHDPLYHHLLGLISGNYGLQGPLDALPFVPPDQGIFTAPSPANGGMYEVAGYVHPQPVLPEGYLAAAMSAWNSDREWIIQQRPYPRGRYEDTRPVAPAIINVLVSDAVSMQRLAEPGVLERYQDSAFPDLARTEKKFCVRFEFENLEPNKHPVQFNEYYKPEGPSLNGKQVAGRRSRRVPLSRAGLTRIVAAQLRMFLQLPRQLVFKGRPVNIDHLVIVEIRRPSAGSVQPELMIHRNFRHLYAAGSDAL